MNHMMPNISNIEDLLTCVKDTHEYLVYRICNESSPFFVRLGTLIVWLYDGTSWSFIILAHNEQIIEHFRVNFFKGV